MSNFVNKYKKGLSGKGQSKSSKKDLTKALHETFKMAQGNQIGGILHEGVKYLLLKHSIYEEIIKNGGKIAVSEEQKEFHKDYQILMQIMNALRIEVKEEEDLFTLVDQFTFEFSDNMNDPKGAKTRREIKQRFQDLIASSELLIEMNDNFRKQLFPDDYKEEVENNGKLE